MEDKTIINKKTHTSLKDVSSIDKIFKNFKNNFFTLGFFYLKSILKEWILFCWLLFSIFGSIFFSFYILNETNKFAKIHQQMGLSNIMNHAFLLPLLFVNTIMVPLFYSKLIEYNNIKRIACAGITKQQFTFIIILINILLLLSLSLLAYGPIYKLFLYFFNSKPYNISHQIKFTINYNEMNLSFFLPTYILAIALFTQVGLLFAAKIKGVKLTLILSVAIYFILYYLLNIGGFFDIFSAGGWSSTKFLPIKQPWLKKLLFCLRWFWVINPLTWVIQGLMVAPKYAGFVTIGNPFTKILVPALSTLKTDEHLRLIVQIMGLSAAIIMTTILSLLIKKYIKFQSLR